jgi:amino acid transporter
MAARVLYGLAGRGEAPAALGRVSPRTRTPVGATVAVGAVVLGLALFFPLTGLARATSTVILVVFALVNAALVVIKRRDGPPAHADAPTYPIAFPVLGALSCAAILVFEMRTGW